MYAALHADIILQRPIASVLYWAWLVRVPSGLFPAACLSQFVLALHVVRVVL